MQKKPRKSITEEQWQKAVETFELGYKNGSQIARDLDVSEATVSREFNRRGALKGCRADETIVDLVAELNELMRSLMAASKAGNLSAVNYKIREVGGALGVRLAR